MDNRGGSEGARDADDHTGIPTMRCFVSLEESDTDVESKQGQAFFSVNYMMDVHRRPVIPKKSLEVCAAQHRLITQ